MQLIERFGLFILVPILFVIVGVSMAINIAWGLLTGGPRALQRPGAPYLYDRVYYLLFLVALIGWASGLLSFVSEASEAGGDGPGFALGWGILAIGMGSLFLLRGDMMLNGAQYQAKHGFWLFRFFNQMQAAQLERQPQAVRKLIPVVFIVAGMIMLAVNLPQLPLALKQVETGGGILLGAVTGP